MAIYRLSADVVKRADGRTVTAAAAYRAGARIIDHRIGLVFDYRPRRGVMHRAILAPAGAPQWMRDRAALWNGIEATEKRKDAQLAREIILALPHELELARQRDLVHGFATAAFVDAGMVADIAIHAPDRHGDERNYHAHILLTLREIDGDTFGAKARAWNSPTLLEQWRAQWADHVNRVLAAVGELVRVDHRSLAGQGIEHQPQPKLGPAVRAMEARGILTDKGDELRAVLAANAEIDRRAAIDPPPIDLYQRADTAPAGQVHDGMQLEIDDRVAEMPAIAVSVLVPMKRTIGGGIRDLFRVVMKKVLRRGEPEPQPRPRCRYRYRKQLEPPRALRHMGSPFAQ
jgi:MobA/MobL family